MNRRMFAFCLSLAIVLTLAFALGARIYRWEVFVLIWTAVAYAFVAWKASAS